MSDTPRVDAATKAAIEHGTGDVWFVAMKLERELNAANAHIKRLEEAGDAMKASGYFGGWADAVNKWNKSKEDKP